MATEQERELRATLNTARMRRRDAVMFEVFYAILALATGIMAFASNWPMHSRYTCWLMCIVTLVNAATFAARRVAAGSAVTSAQAALNAYISEHEATSQESEPQQV